MAERRMFTKKITESDAFLDMPASTQALYFHLNMSADDDGFVNNPKRIQRLVGASDDDIKLLIAKSFVLVFESGIIVIKHWKMHNYIQSDRYRPTDYQDEMSLLSIKANKAYTLDFSEMDTKCIQNVSVGKVRIGKDRLDKNKDIVKKKRFTPPTENEVELYLSEMNYKHVDAERFISFYESKNWMVGKNKMSDWKAAVRGWESREKKQAVKKNSFNDIQKQNYDFDSLEDDLLSKNNLLR